jgi:hypothetical protein
MQETQEQWVTMREAATTLKLSYYKIQRLAAQGSLSTRDDVLDKRVKLVNLEEVRRVFRIR